jgi:hypothetical protein
MLVAKVPSRETRLLFSTPDNPLTGPVVGTLLAFEDMRRGVAAVISPVDGTLLAFEDMRRGVATVISSVDGTLLAFEDMRRGVATVISPVKTSSWAVAMTTRRTTIQMYFDIFIAIED